MRTLTFRRSLVPAVLAATLLAAFVFLFAWPQPAAAHEALIDSSPAEGSTVETLPDELTLTFSGVLLSGEGTTAVEVLDAEGNDLAEGEPVVDGAVVTQPLAAEAAAGEYQVIWRVVYGDGHDEAKQYNFSVATSTLAEQPTSSPSATPEESTAAEEITPSETVAPATEDPRPAQDADTASPMPWPWIIGIAIVVGIAAVVIITLSRRKRGSSDRPAER